MEILQGVELTQLAGIIVDFGFIGTLFAVILYILARSPFQMELQFQGGIKVGKNGDTYGHTDETIQYGYTKHPTKPNQAVVVEQAEAQPANRDTASVTHEELPEAMPDSFLGEDDSPKAPARQITRANNG